MKIGRIVQFKTAEYLINELFWNKKDAEQVGDKIGVVISNRYNCYEIRLLENEDCIVVSNEKGFFIPNGFIKTNLINRESK